MDPLVLGMIPAITGLSQVPHAPNSLTTLETQRT